MIDIISRGVPLDDLSVSGRTVTAYAAVFGVSTEISDKHGRYNEDIHRTAFNKTIREAGKKAGYFYNHGMTIHGTPSDMASIPLGTAESVQADSKGLLTVSRVSKGPMGDAVLEAINDGAITGYSFTGRVIRSNPARIGRTSASGELPKVTRMELGLQEYGPTPFPAYSDASIVAVRSGLPLVDQYANLSDDDKALLLYNLLTRATTLLPVAPSTSTPEAGTAEPSGNTHSERVRELIRKRIDSTGVRNWSNEAERGTSRAS